MTLSRKNKALMERSLGAYSLVRLRDFEKVSDESLDHLLNAAREEGRQEYTEIIRAVTYVSSDGGVYNSQRECIDLRQIAPGIEKAHGVKS